ncbi:hypothetical protein PLESTM_001896700 [Pleodorina starrii]|nr:hypothetical protein PLESTM_001896700 [Pleodorina starrii]
MTQGIGSALAELLLALDMDARTLCLAASHRRRARERRRAHEAWRPAAALLYRPIGAWDAVLGSVTESEEAAVEASTFAPPLWLYGSRAEMAATATSTANADTGSAAVAGTGSFGEGGVK